VESLGKIRNPLFAPLNITGKIYREESLGIFSARFTGNFTGNSLFREICSGILIFPLFLVLKPSHLKAVTVPFSGNILPLRCLALRNSTK